MRDLERKIMVDRIIENISTWNFVRGNVEFNENLEHDMLVEEVNEFRDAKTPEDTADALADIIFVAIGSLYKLSGKASSVKGIMDEVIAANYRKGKKKNEAGKIIKPSNFVGPEKGIKKILQKTKGLFDE